MGFNSAFKGLIKAVDNSYMPSSMVSFTFICSTYLLTFLSAANSVTVSSFETKSKHDPLK